MTSACIFSLLWGSAATALLVIAAEDQGSCSPPARLYFAELTDEYKDKTSFPVGSTVKYKCRPGYYGFKKLVTCLESLEWSEAPKFCEEKKCRNPGEPANGQLIVPKDLRFGSTVNFTCDEGHRLIGPSSIWCVVVGQKVEWSDRIPFCQRIPCYPPPDIPHGKQKGKYNQEDYYYGDAVTYICDKGYPHVGDAFIYCTTKDGENGVWSGRLSCGVTTCPAPEVENGGIVAGDSDTYIYKHKVTLSCHAGHILTGSREIYCQADGTWDPPVPLCEHVIQCSTPPSITNGKYNTQASQAFIKGAFVEYSCEPTHKLIGEARIYCTESGTWSSPAPYCEVKQCQRPPNIQHGIHSNQEAVVFTRGMFVMYTCEPGYTLIGEKTIHCTQFGNWNQPAPYCNGNCGPPMNLKLAELTNEYKNKTSFPVGSTVKYMCRPGYAGLRTSIKCLSHLKWSDINEFCRKKSCRNPGDPENGRLIVPEDFLFGSTVNFTCDEGHKLIGQSSMQCVLSGPNVIWSGKIPFCQRIRCYSPPDIPHGKQKYNQEDYYYGDAVTYTCDKGYSPVGDTFIHCTTKDGENGVWSGRLSCGVLYCPVPPDIANGYHNATAGKIFTSHMSVTYFCDPGYSLIGKASVSCTSSGDWSLPQPHCEVKGCVGPEIQNGRKSSSNLLFKPMEKVTFECDHGYILKGNTTIQCQPDSRWDFPVPLCVRVMHCHRPPQVQNGFHSNQELAVFSDGMSVKYTCKHGYTLIGEATIYCTESGTWTLPAPHCKGCLAPEKIANGKPDTEILKDFAYGSSVTYLCDPGYFLTGAATIYCLSSGIWEPPVPQCKDKGCIRPEIQNGRKAISKLQFKPKEKITFECAPGYILKGNNTIECQSDSTWDLPVPLCVRAIGCILPQIPGGKKANIINMFQSGDNMIVQCEDGYVLEGSPYIQCQHDFVWDPPVPVCKPGFYLLASISFGSLIGFLLFLGTSGIIWMAVSKQKKVRYTSENSKEISNSSNGRI